MAFKFRAKIILPNVVDFVRYLHEVLLTNTRNSKDTETVLEPLVSRAKSLVNKEGIKIAAIERKN